MSKYTRRPLTTINVTPLVDVLLILLVIVMLAMPLFVKRLPVSLPETSLTAAPAAVKSLRVSLGPNKTYFVDDTLTSSTDVLSRVTTQTTVELYVDGEVSYKDLAQFTAQLYEKSPREVVLMSR